MQKDRQTTRQLFRFLAGFMTFLIFFSPAFSASAQKTSSTNSSTSVVSHGNQNEGSQGDEHKSDSAKKDLPPSERGQGSSKRGDNSQGHGKGHNKGSQPGTSKGGGSIAINVLIRGSLTPSVIASLEKHGRIIDKFPQINVVTMRVNSDELQLLAKLDFVSALNEDSVREASPIVESATSESADGESTWNLDMINVADGIGAESSRTVSATGSGVYVAVLDTGLVKNWRYYFGSSIAEQFAAAFGGGGGEHGTVSTQPDKWELDQDSHGTHVTSTIIGYNYPGRKIMGVAPDAMVIPVKVLGQQGSGWSSVIARGIMYVADLKAGPLKNHPVVINMSLGGPTLDVMEKSAIDYAISKGVLIVASAGNSGNGGMGYPGAYAPVISVAAVGWTGEWQSVPAGQKWWRSVDVAENGSTSAYITDFSSREKSGQQLDIAAPGSWIVGPYQTNGQLNWFYLGGTSMAAPHVTGVVALMAEKRSSITQSQTEQILKSTASPFSHWSSQVKGPNGTVVTYSWGTDATGAGLIDASNALSHL